MSGCSAGGVDALRQIARGLPDDLEAPVLVVLHIPSDAPSLLAQILSRATELRVKEAEDGEPLRNGVIYCAVPDRQLLVEPDGTLRVVRGRSENRHCPAVDPLFRSAAVAYGRHAIGVVLTGTLDDGTAGLLALRNRGGVAVVQDPMDAMYPSMPQSAIDQVNVDHVVPLAGMAELLVTLVSTPPPRAHDGDGDPDTRDFAGQPELAIR